VLLSGDSRGALRLFRWPVAEPLAGIYIYWVNPISNIYVYLFTRMHICIHIFINVYIHIYSPVTRVARCVCFAGRSPSPLQVYTYIGTFMYIYSHVCIYVYTYSLMYTYIYTLR